MGKQKKKEKNKTKKRNGASKQRRNCMSKTERLLAEAAQIVRQDQGRPNSIGALARNPPKGTGQRNVGGIHSSYMMRGGFKESKDKSKEQIEQEKIKARVELKTELVTLAMAGASKIISAQVDKKTSNEILKDFIAKI